MSLRTFTDKLSDETPVMCAYRIHHQNMPVELVEVIDRVRKKSIFDSLDATDKGLLLEQAERDHMKQDDFEYEDWKEFQLGMESK